MSSTITSSGVGSGNDFESIISASVAAKRQQYEKRTTTRKSEAQIEKDGLNSLQSALKTFKEKCDELTKDNSLNTHAVNTNQSKDYTAFTVKAEEDCSNMSFDLCVTQLSKAESVSQSFNTADGFQNSFSAGMLTIDLGTEEYKDDNGVTQTRDRVFTVDIYEGDTIELVRKRINQNDYDVNVGLIKTSDGYSFSISSGQTGQGTTNLKITAEGSDTPGHDSLSCFNFNPDTDTQTVDGEKVSNGNSKWNYSEGKDAKILVDGHEVTSHTNNFDEGQISGLSITVSQLSELTTLEDGSTGRKTYAVDVTTDANAATSKMQSFVDAYNALMSSMDTLYKRNTYTDGKNNYDGGDLSGDSQLKALQNEIQNMVVKFTKESTGKSIFDCGIEFNKDGTLSIDSEDFKKNLNENFNSVVSLFTEDDGLIDKLSDYVKEYTQTGGILAERINNVQNEIDDWTQKEQDNEEKLEKYEQNLRTKYGNLDSLMSSYNTSLSYISSILG